MFDCVGDQEWGDERRGCVSYVRQGSQIGFGWHYGVKCARRNQQVRGFKRECEWRLRNYGFSRSYGAVKAAICGIVTVKATNERALAAKLRSMCAILHREWR